jgi:uncharacterized membrane protein
MQEKITRSIIVKSTPEQVFRVWSNFEEFPRFMRYIDSVQKTGDRTSHWVLSGPLGKDIEWEAEITNHEPNQRIGWSTKDRDGDITTSGQVTFQPLSDGETQVNVLMNYTTQKGVVGDVVARLFANPEKQLEEDLSNLKAYIEGMNNHPTI